MKHTNNNPAKIERNLNLAQARLQGKTLKQLSKEFDLSIAMCSYILNDKEIKSIIEDGTKQMISYVPLATQNYLTFLYDQENEHHYKASKDVLQAGGILSSHATSINIKQIINNDNRSVLIPAIKQLFNKQLDIQRDETAEYDILDDDN